MSKKHPRMRNTLARQPLAVSVLLRDLDLRICVCKYKPITTFDCSRPSIDLAMQLLVGKKMDIICKEMESPYYVVRDISCSALCTCFDDDFVLMMILCYVPTQRWSIMCPSYPSKVL